MLRQNAIALPAAWGCAALLTLLSFLCACNNNAVAPKEVPETASPPAEEAPAAAAAPVAAPAADAAAPAADAAAPAEAPAPGRAPSHDVMTDGASDSSEAIRPNPHSDVDRALAGLATANIAFNSPGRVNVHETVQVELLLSLKKTIAELDSELKAPGKQEGASVQVAERMEARLTGPDFQITAITPEVQAVGSSGTVQWRWEIKPTLTGRHDVHLTLTALLIVEGISTPKAIRTFDRQIEVEVRPGQSVVDFVRGNWQWLWAAIVIPALGVFWKRQTKRKAAP